MKIKPMVPLEHRFKRWEHKLNYVRKALAAKQYREQGVKPLDYDENKLCYIIEHYTYAQIEKVFYEIWEYRHKELWKEFVERFVVEDLPSVMVEYWLQDDTIDKLWHHYSSKIEANSFELDNYWQEESEDFYS
jgi:hypothetical protein